MSTSSPEFKVGQSLTWENSPECSGHSHSPKSVSFRRMIDAEHAEVFTCRGSQNVSVAELSDPNAPADETHTSEFNFADGSKVLVYADGLTHDRDDFGAYRQQYAYVITSSDWEYVGNDIHSGCGAAVDVASGARTLFTFLSACVEARQYTRERRLAPAENDDLFPDHVAEWASQNSDEIEMFSIDPAELDGE